MATPRIDSKLPAVGTTIFAVMSQKAADHGAFNLSQGFPDFHPPERLQALLTEAMQEGLNQYAPLHGLPMLREAIAEKVARLYGREVDVNEEITVTSGATEALFDAVQAVVHPGDEVIVLDPAYDAYEPAVELAGGRTVHVPLTSPDFHIDWDRLATALTPKTRLLILNTPHNPAGAVLGHDELDRLAALLRDTDTLVLSDEVYEHIVFDGAHRSVLGHPDLAERAFAVSSFGKTYHCTGWKIGYCIAPAGLTREFRKVHQYVTFATMAPAQAAFSRYMRENPAHTVELPEFYRAKRDRLAEWLDRSRFTYTPAPGTYFQLIDYRAIADVPDTEFCDRLIREAGVAAVPISVFYETPPTDQRLVRLCFAKEDATLDAAGERLAKL
ncbi:methionine aminotransferase [Arhodomonas sp. AD133]|uniref:methionine aminotransferase n=1 Tax=Arhodomonas sp. AD133 TaxID=3415009 RepID=UPI003EB9F11F